MGTIGSSLSSTTAPAATSATSSNPTGIFTGTSSFSGDFQNLVDRATAIASLPLTPLTTQQDALNAQADELTKIDTRFTALQTAIQGIQNAMAGSALRATVTDPTILTATPGDGASEGQYSINVIGIGAYSASLTAQSWNSAADPSGKPTTYNLVLGGTAHTFSPADNSAITVASTINAQYGNLVNATAVNVGPTDTPDWRISLQSAALGPGTVSIEVPAQASLQRQQTATTDGYSVSQSAWSWDSTADPSGAATTYTLAVGATQLTFSLTDNSISAVVNAINGLAGNPVQASAVDLGTATNHDYRLKLRSNTTGKMTLDLHKSTSVQLQNQRQPPGSLAQYEVVGSGTTVTSKTRSIQVSTGTTLTLAAPGTTDVIVMRSTSALDTALQAFTTAYNAAFDEINAQHGQSAGALQGNPIVYSLQQTLRSISTYNSTGPVNGLASLGVSLGTNGHIAYDPLTLMGVDLSNSAGVTAFFGSATGGGFLKTATAALKGLEDSTTGLLKSTESTTQTQLSDIGKTITDKQNQVQQLQLNLQNQLAHSDALIAAMQQQYSYMSSMFSAMQTANQMYSNGG